MIKSLRIDERLIHGQVAVAWCTTLSVDSILVVNDKAASDEIETVSLKMAAPSNIRVVVKSVKDAIRLLNDPRIVNRTLLIIVKTPQDALSLLKNALDIPDVNVGNYGMINAEDRKQLKTSLAVNDEDIKVFNEILELRPNSFYQMTPTLPIEKLKDLII